MGKCKKDVAQLLTHWSYVFLALTHPYRPLSNRMTQWFMAAAFPEPCKIASIILGTQVPTPWNGTRTAPYNLKTDMTAWIDIPGLLTSLWPCDATQQHRSGSTLAQVMACCLKAPSHYLSRCWLIDQRGLVAFISEGNFTRYLNHQYMTPIQTSTAVAIW